VEKTISTILSVGREWDQTRRRSSSGSLGNKSKAESVTASGGVARGSSTYDGSFPGRLLFLVDIMAMSEMSTEKFIVEEKTCEQVSRLMIVDEEKKSSLTWKLLSEGIKG